MLVQHLATTVVACAYPASRHSGTFSVHSQCETRSNLLRAAS